MIKQVITTERIPIKLWLDDIEKEALDQAKNIANLPFSFGHIALMPGTHKGYGMPIESVLATENVIVPNAVGNDIGCGMIAIQTSVINIKKEDLKTIIDEVRKKIPIRFRGNKIKTPDLIEIMPFSPEKLPIVDKEYDNAISSLGTLGSGNHFIEFQKDEEGYVWIMIHSGSRNLGSKVAQAYNKTAKELNEKWFSSVPKEHDLAFLPINSEEGLLYMKEMMFCIKYARANRGKMLEICIKTMKDVLKTDFKTSEEIDVIHNYVKIENFFGKNLFIHRKGAISAKIGEIGIIPGDQGSKSYIVSGKGITDSFTSCSHGAGRKLSRTDAKKDLDLEVEKKKLDDLDIIHSLRSNKDLEEASGAYKDIDIVMENQKDLVDIKFKLTPLGVIKE